jgi:hypothetical protein
MLIGLALQAIVVAACSFSEVPGVGSASPSPQPETSEGGRTGQPSLPGSTPALSAQPLPPRDAEVLTGILGFAAVEGGCGFLETSAGKRYEVIYPEGWRLDRATNRLVGPDGRTAGAGATVSVRGAIATDIASICQIGPMFRATEVDIGD